MKTKVKDQVMVPLSTYVGAKNKTWLANAAKKNKMKIYQFLDKLVSDARKSS